MLDKFWGAILSEDECTNRAIMDFLKENGGYYSPENYDYSKIKKKSVIYIDGVSQIGFCKLKDFYGNAPVMDFESAKRKRAFEMENDMDYIRSKRAEKDENTMEWEYKKHKITVNEDGMFVTEIKTGNKTEKRKCSTLQGCKNAIDTITENYYTFTNIDFEKLMSKLSEREKECLTAIFEKFKESYCLEFPFKDSEWNWEFLYD